MEPDINKADGRPIKPSFKTIEINLIGVMYSELGLFSSSQCNILPYDSHTYRTTLSKTKQDQRRP